MITTTKGGPGARLLASMAWSLGLLTACVQPQPGAAPQERAASPRAAAAPTEHAGGEHLGQIVYRKACASCHDHPQATRSPALETLRAMRYQVINYALTSGKMQVQAAGLNQQERVAVIEYLAGQGRGAVDEAWIAQQRCTAQRGPLDLDTGPTVAGFGFDISNQRRLSAAQAGLRTADLRHLELAWALAFPQATAMRSQPAVVGRTLFLPVADSARLFAIDIGKTPCLRWVYQSPIPLRTSAAYGVLPQARRKVIVLGDAGANIHMVDAQTGELLWRQSVGLYPYSVTTGTPVLHESRVYVPISQYEIALGGEDAHECCKTHGAVAALDALTGRVLWVAHTMEEAKPRHDRGDGRMLWGPSGAPVWTSPAIDVKRRLLYVGTGEATSAPAAPTTDAILAIGLDDGALRWHFQATAHDIFLTGCVNRRDGLNCPREGVFRDVDFGASVIIAQRADDSDVLLAGQKSGTLWALDPQRSGAVLWRQDFGSGSPLGGIHWGIASDGERVFAPINRTYGLTGPTDPAQQPGLHALKIDSGEVLWRFSAAADCSGERASRVKNCASQIGLSGAPTVIDGAVVAGSLDGWLRIFDARSGEVLFVYDTARPFTAVNDVPAHGGSIDNASIVAAQGYLFVSSGYGAFGQTPGNVLLAFRPAAPSQPGRTVDPTE